MDLYLKKDELMVGTCPDDYGVKALVERQNQQMMRVNGLIIVNAILAGILVGIGAYGPRYRHHAFIRFLFQGATTLFLPIFSYVISNGFTTASILREGTSIFSSGEGLGGGGAFCTTAVHLLLVLLWAVLVQIVGISTCAVVAADDREGRNIGLPLVLLAQAVWTFYLAFNTLLTSGFIKFFLKGLLVLLAGFPLLFGRIALKYYAFRMARRSFALGRNPRLIIGYMEHLSEESHHVRPTVGHLSSPKLIVMGEERQQVEKQPHGYCFKQKPNQDLVTIDKVWRVDDVLLRSIPEIKDICFSFALFKLLRCRFAGYTVAETGFMKTYNLFWHVLLKDNDVGRVLKDSDSEKLPKNNDAERVFRVLENELSFLHDYYYSSLPISYSKSWLVISSIITSLLTIIYCLLVGLVVVDVDPELPFRGVEPELRFGNPGQIVCEFRCGRIVSPASIGSNLFDKVQVILLLVLVVLAEIKDIASYVCSNWTKVALICRYAASHDRLEQSPRISKWISHVLQCRCKLMKHWSDKMNQCSILVLHPIKPSTALIMRVLHLPDQKKKVKIPTLVKAAIIDTLKSSNGIQFSGVAFLQRSLQDSNNNFPWDNCSGRGTADTILIWHIVTSILEVRHTQPLSPASDNYKIVATHLSRYCAYLVAYVPELLPDDDQWCKSLYKAVKKDAALHVLAGGGVAAADKYEHEVVTKGVIVGEWLAEWTEGEEAAWRVLAGFWSETLLSVAPSENLNGHADAVARGGELVTLVWALLMHAGPRTAAAASADAAGVV